MCTLVQLMLLARAYIANITCLYEVRPLGIHLNIFTLVQDKTQTILATITETHPL
jgi:hypothetical protein